MTFQQIGLDKSYLALKYSVFRCIELILLKCHISFVTGLHVFICIYPQKRRHNLNWIHCMSLCLTHRSKDQKCSICSHLLRTQNTIVWHAFLPSYSLPHLKAVYCRDPAKTFLPGRNSLRKTNGCTLPCSLNQQNITCKKRNIWSSGLLAMYLQSQTRCLQQIIILNFKLHLVRDNKLCIISTVNL